MLYWLDIYIEKDYYALLSVLLIVCCGEGTSEEREEKVVLVIYRERLLCFSVRPVRKRRKCCTDYI